MQEKVIQSLSNIENLMVNKLVNTQQKLSVLKSSDKKDVLEFLSHDQSQRSHRKDRNRRSKLRNVLSIQGEMSSRPVNPPMRFVDRSNTMETWHRKPKATLMSASMDFDAEMKGRRKRSRSKGATKNFAYVSMISNHPIQQSSRSRSVSKQETRKRSPSVRSKKSSKPRKFKKLFNREVPEFQNATTSLPAQVCRTRQNKRISDLEGNPLDDSIIGPNDSLDAPTMQQSFVSHTEAANDHSLLTNLPTKRIIRVKRNKKRRVLKNAGLRSSKGSHDVPDTVQFIP